MDEYIPRCRRTQHDRVAPVPFEPGEQRTFLFSGTRRNHVIMDFHRSGGPAPRFPEEKLNAGGNFLTWISFQPQEDRVPASRGYGPRRGGPRGYLRQKLQGIFRLFDQAGVFDRRDGGAPFAPPSRKKGPDVLRCFKERETARIRLPGIYSLPSSHRLTSSTEAGKPSMRREPALSRPPAA